MILSIEYIPNYYKLGYTNFLNENSFNNYNLDCFFSNRFVVLAIVVAI